MRPVQQPVQGGLIHHRAGDNRLAVIAVDLQASNQAVQPWSRTPSTRISYRAAPLTPARLPVTGSGRRAFKGEFSRLYCPFIGFRDLHATKQHAAWRHPKVPIRWNLPPPQPGTEVPGPGGGLFAAEGHGEKGGGPARAMGWPDQGRPGKRQADSR